MHNLHGLPGVLGGMCSAIAAGDIRDYLYGHDVNADGRPIGVGLVMPARCAALRCVRVVSVFRGMLSEACRSSMGILHVPWHCGLTPLGWCQAGQGPWRRRS